MSKFKLNPLSIALLGAIATPTFAETTTENQNHQLSTIVVSAAGYEQKITDAPASISVITKEDLEKKPYTTLLDAVRELEGVDVGETRDKTGQGTISMRGMGSDYTLILVDGKRQNNHGDIYPNSFNGNQFGHIPPLDAIERIEVIRGPASTLYGADAMGGVINIITKKVTDEWTGSITHGRTLSSGAYGNDSTTDINVMGPIIPNKLGLSLRGSFYDRNGSSPEYAPYRDQNGNLKPRDIGFGSGGRTVDNENQSFGARLTWTPTDNQTIRFDIDSSTQEYDNSQAQLGTLDGINSIWLANNTSCFNSTNCTRANPRVGYLDKQKFTRDTWSITHEGEWDLGKSFISLAHVKTNNKGRTLPFTVSERKELLDIMNDSSLSIDERKEKAEQTFLPRPKRTLESEQLTLDANISMPFELAGKHTAIVGTQIIDGELTDGVFGMESGTPGGAQEHKMWSLFVEDTWNITEPFALTTGIRYDNHDIFGDQFSPRLYGVYTFSDALTVKGGVSTGYKTPKTTQLYDGIVGFGGQGTSPQFGNPDLKPETSVSSELAVYWQSLTGHNFNATIFHNKFEDKINSQPCGPTTDLACASTGEYAEIGYNSSSTRITNIDEAVIQGLELAGKYQINDQWDLRANYTYTDSEQKSGAQKGQPLTNNAKHMANATLNWEVNDKLSTFLTLEHRSKRFNQVITDTNEEIYFKGYEMFHLGASYKATDNITFNGRINNLFGKDFTSYDTRFVDGEAVHYDHYNNKEADRSFWFSVNARF
ncbi:TonB-dependent receptor [Acinetobacter faecalis]|uniref:TonB-dependent receptor domain-containing protein n=1 Tax=Acinetobacter faecalis TaxID=2665161 RepID=UPI002A92023F|nr:TonB-dependent receptor [Acinetobacter faecalis]MDY6456447.1 TonB-dependent receptor [Acinetobacter faecalis]MDY6468112.1 TonB-dependent receptor [Acinetobacter faecalis]